jgi:regulator of protease activity HflC (stomatin/prohibitin superfamily)
VADRPDEADPDDDTGDDTGGDKTLDLEGEPSLLGAAAPEVVGSARKSRRRAAFRPKGPRRRFPVWLGVLAAVLGVVLLALTPTVASGLVKTPRDKIGISYGGGPIEGVHYQRTVPPGSSLSWNGFLDPLYEYPSDQQNYIVSKSTEEGTATADAVQAPSKDRVLIEFQVAVYFKLNTDMLQPFHEQLGLKYKAYTDDGWDQLIEDTFRQQIENALQEETRRSNVADLYGDAELLIDIQNRVQETLSANLAAALGDQFFCSPEFEPGEDCEDPTFIVKSLTVPEQVAKAYESNRTSQVQIETEENEVLQRQAEAEGIEALSDALATAGDDYVLLKAIESGDISFWVIPDESGLTLTTPDTPTAGEGGTTTTTTTPPAGG